MQMGKIANFANPSLMEKTHRNLIACIKQNT